MTDCGKLSERLTYLHFCIVVTATDRLSAPQNHLPGAAT
jgi:hypothetical protein